MGATSLANVTSPDRAALSESAPNATDCVVPATDRTNKIERPIRMVTSLWSDDFPALIAAQYTPVGPRQACRRHLDVVASSSGCPRLIPFILGRDTHGYWGQVAVASVLMMTCCGVTGTMGRK
jgi:hypothetical protein